MNALFVSPKYPPVKRPPGVSVGDVQTEMAYLGQSTGRPVHYAMPPPEGEDWEQASYEPVSVSMRDARGLQPPPQLEVEGFELLNHRIGNFDLTDHAQIKLVHYAQIEGLVRERTGAKRAFVFDHLVRRRESDRRPLSFGRAPAQGLAATNGRIHNDYTELSGRKRLDLVMERAQTRFEGSRFAIVNLWRSIAGPVLDTPLGVCDSRTVQVDDLVTAEVRYPGRVGEIYVMRHTPRHRWHYFSEMDRDEVLIFKQYDSQLSGVSRFTPHAAFDHPLCPPGAPLRQSIEIRCLITFD